MGKMTLQQAEERFGKEAVNKLMNMQAEPTGRLIYPAFEPQHAEMQEYAAGSVPVEGGKIYAYYFQPSEKNDDEWQFGEMNGIEYGNIDNIEFVEDCD